MFNVEDISSAEGRVWKGMSTFKRFEEIGAWQKARELTKKIYEVTRTGPFAKDFALRDQIRRAATSVMSNIAEGFERDGRKEFIQYLSTAKGSSGEVRSQLYIALDQQYVSRGVFQELTDISINICRMITGLMHYLQSSHYKGVKYKNIEK